MRQLDAAVHIVQKFFSATRLTIPNNYRNKGINLPNFGIHLPNGYCTSACLISILDAVQLERFPKRQWKMNETMLPVLKVRKIPSVKLYGITGKLEDSAH